MQIHAASRPRDDTDAEPHHWVVEAEEYEAGLAEIYAGVPEGWVLLYVRPVRDPQ